jgi:hypothetical protein
MRDTAMRGLVRILDDGNAPFPQRAEYIPIKYNFKCKIMSGLMSVLG